MTRELFEKAKFGDRFVTRGGQEALFLRLTENSEWQFADFYVKDWGQIRVNRENGKCLNGPDIENDIVGMMPSLPSDLDEAANKFGVKETVTMDWKRLFKSICYALLLIAGMCAIMFVIVYGRFHLWVLVVVAVLAFLAILVDKIYHSNME